MLDLCIIHLIQFVALAIESGAQGDYKHSNFRGGQNGQESDPFS